MQQRTLYTVFLMLSIVGCAYGDDDASYIPWAADGKADNEILAAPTELLGIDGETLVIPTDETVIVMNDDDDSFVLRAANNKASVNQILAIPTIEYKRAIGASDFEDDIETRTRMSPISGEVEYDAINYPRFTLNRGKRNVALNRGKRNVAFKLNASVRTVDRETLVIPTDATVIADNDDGNDKFKPRGVDGIDFVIDHQATPTDAYKRGIYGETLIIPTDATVIMDNDDDNDKFKPRGVDFAIDHQ